MVNSDDGINYFLYDSYDKNFTPEEYIEENLKEEVTIIGRYDISIYDESNLSTRFQVLTNLKGELNKKG